MVSKMNLIFNNSESENRKRYAEDSRILEQITDKMKACFKTSFFYSCADRRCPVRSSCMQSVSPWKFS
jgi:hypothetical protein